MKITRELRDHRNFNRLKRKTSNLKKVLGGKDRLAVVAWRIMMSMTEL